MNIAKGAQLDSQTASTPELTPPVAPKRIAVVGSGISGLIAAWILSKTNTVTLFENDDRLGGHAHTHTVRTTPESHSETTNVDSGFIVFNERTYPTLIRFFRELGVESQASDMSMSITCQGCGLSYAGGKGLRGIFPRGAGNALRPSFLKMLLEIKRFHRLATRLLESTAEAMQEPTFRDPAAPTLGEFLREHRFSAHFTSHFLTPLISAVWSCNAATAAQYPARYLFTFLQHHGMLSVSGSPQWRTVTGGSQQYVRKAAASIADIRLGSPVQSIKDDGVKVTITSIPTLVANTASAPVAVADRSTPPERVGAARLASAAPASPYGADPLMEEFDAVVIATHPDQAASLLEDGHPAKSILSDMPYSVNETALHCDASVLPSNPDASASWNYLLPDCGAMPEDVLVSYDLSRLQSLGRPGGKPFVVSLGLGESIDDDTVLDRMTYEHPQYTPESLRAQAELSNLNSPRIAFAGAYHGWGFHEDGALAGARAAKHLGGVWPE